MESIRQYENVMENAVTQYKLANSNDSSITYDKIKNLIKYNGDRVTCDIVQIHENGTVGLSNCKVGNSASIVMDNDGKAFTYGRVILPKCIRATTLHTELCEQTNATYFCSGAGYTASGSKKTTTITYGSLGTPGTLTSGDAFDCDVNGDGNYDGTKERFYYVSEKDGEETSNYVTLIYYNNIIGDTPDNTSSSSEAYDLSKQNYGPVTAITRLPKTSDWTNITLTDTPRSIKNEMGGTTTNNGSIALSTSFSYSGYVARLLTVQEINKACNVTLGSSKLDELNKCNYLFENTKYSSTSKGTNGYWLENPNSVNYSGIWSIFGNSRNVNTMSVDATSNSGVRPAIVISKSDISY